MNTGLDVFMLSSNPVLCVVNTVRMIIFMLIIYYFFRILEGVIDAKMQGGVCLNLVNMRRSRIVAAKTNSGGGGGVDAKIRGGARVCRRELRDTKSRGGGLADANLGRHAGGGIKKTS